MENSLGTLSVTRPLSIRRVCTVLVLAWIAVMSSMQLRWHDADSMTRDEPLHFIRGMAYWWEGDPRLSYAHPPLANLFSTYWVAKSWPSVSLSAAPSWERSEVEPTFDWMRRIVPYEDLRRMLMDARKPGIILYAALGMYLFFWALSFFGLPIAVAGTLLYSIHPTVLAHSRLCTTDFAMALTSTLFIGEWIRFLIRRSGLGLGLAALALGLCFGVKHSAFILVILASASGLWVWRKGLGPFARGPGSTRTLWASGAALLLLLTPVLVVNAAYGFKDSGLTVREILDRPEPGNWITGKFKNVTLERYSPLALLPDGLRVPLPYTFILGFASIQAHNMTGHDGYLFGIPYHGGLPFYFPAVLVMKAPLLMGILLLFGFWAFLSKRRRMEWLRVKDPAAVAAVIFCFGFLALCMFARINIGDRHLLAVLPVLTVLVAAFGIRVYENTRVSGMQPLMVLLSFEAIAASLAVAPLHLGFHSLIGGGPVLGPYLSIVAEDWGQDMRAAAQALQSRGVTQVYADEYGWVAKEEYAMAGVRSKALTCKTQVPSGSWVAAHRSVTFRGGPNCHSGWIHRAVREEVVNGHVDIYRVN